MKMSRNVFVLPKCGHCGTPIIEGVTISVDPVISYGLINALHYIYPSRCPKCDTFFDHVEIDEQNETCILRRTEPKPKRGRWRYSFFNPRRSVPIEVDMTCSCCGRKISRLHGWNFNFCPMCGADMREEGK